MTEAEKKLIYGKKVLFFTQDNQLISAIKTRLIEMEYEIYILNNIKIIKNVLSENPESILFITIDERLTIQGWNNFIKSINKDVEFNTTHIGLLTGKISNDKMSMLKSGLNLDAGCEQIEQDSEDTIRHIVKTLDKLNAKGVRQYVRASCITDKSTEIFWLDGDKMRRFQLVDISTVGLAIQFEDKHYPILQGMKLIPNAKLALKSKQIPISLDIQIVKKAGNGYIMVGMFPLEVKGSSISIIREYVFSRLHELLMEQIAGRRPDETNYNNVVLSADPTL